MIGQYKKVICFIAIKGDKNLMAMILLNLQFQKEPQVLVSEEQYALKWNALLVKDTKISLKNIAQFSRNDFLGKS